MGNENCCAATNEGPENKVTSVDDMVAKRQMARAPAPVFHEKSSIDDYKSTDRPQLNEGLTEKPETKLDDGSTYKGQWRGDKKEGRGVLKYLDGAVYEGNYQ